MFTSLLCPIDFSEVSPVALAHAAAFAVHGRARLTVLAVNDPLLAEAARAKYGPDFLEAETRADAERLLAAAVLPDLRVRFKPRVRVAVGQPAPAILQAVSRAGTDLIVMGTHGLGGWKKLMLGSTTERVLRDTTVPVLAVPPHAAGTRVDRAGAEFHPGPVLVPVDLTRTARDDARIAVALAHMIERPVILLHVVEDVQALRRWRGLLTDGLASKTDAATRTLEAWCRAFGKTAAVSFELRTGDPAEQIAAVARELRAGLIVMGLRRTHDGEPARPGAVAYRVLSSTPVPVLALP